MWFRLPAGNCDGIQQPHLLTYYDYTQHLTRFATSELSSVNVGAQETSYGQSVVSIELVLFYERVSAVYIHLCGRHSSAGLQSRLEQLFQRLFHRVTCVMHAIQALTAVNENGGLRPRYNGREVGLAGYMFCH